MRTSCSLAIALAASLALASAARAGTLITHPILLEPNETLLCLLANEGRKPVRGVDVEVVRYDAMPPATVAGANDIAELAPLQYVAASAMNPAVTAVYLCRFTFPGSGKSLRGSGLLRDDGGAVVESQPAR